MFSIDVIRWSFFALMILLAVPHIISFIIILCRDRQEDALLEEELKRQEEYLEQRIQELEKIIQQKRKSR